MKQGRIIINRNICDNARECSGIEVCQTGAMFWDEENNKIGYHDVDCLDCGLCAESCPVGAILWGEDDEDFEKKKKEVEAETRRLEDLQVERYGAAPMEDNIEQSELQSIICSSSTEYVLLELFSDDSINCLLHSIRVEEIKQLFNASVSYNKVHFKAYETCSLFDVESFPALIILKNGKYIGKVEGYFADDEKEKFFKLISSVISAE